MAIHFSLKRFAVFITVTVLVLGSALVLLAIHTKRGANEQLHTGFVTEVHNSQLTITDPAGRVLVVHIDQNTNIRHGWDTEILSPGMLVVVVGDMRPDDSINARNIRIIHKRP